MFRGDVRGSCIAGRVLGFVMIEDQGVKFVDDGEAAGTPDQFATGKWSCNLAGLFLNLVNEPDEEGYVEGDLRDCGTKVGELVSDMSEAAAMSQGEI